jgi:MoxR-like ATPase
MARAKQAKQAAKNDTKQNEQSALESWSETEGMLSRRLDQQLSALKPVSRVDELLKRAGVSLGRALPPIGLSASGAPLTEREQALYQLQRENTLKALKGCANLNREIASCRQLIKDLKQEARKCLSPNEKLYCQKAIDATREQLHGLLKGFSEIASENPEAFNVVHSRPLRKYARQLDKGRIAELPFVEDVINQSLEALESSMVVVLHGPTGSGKSEVAQIIGRRFSGKEPVVLSGHRDFSNRELRGYDKLTKSSPIDPSEIPTKLEEMKEAYRRANPSVRGAALKNAERVIEQKFIQQNDVTESEFIRGHLYKCMEEGRPAILDEYNLIKLSVLKGMNHILTKQPGDSVDVPEDNGRLIVIKEGFRIIMTGNLNTGGGAQYFDIEDQDPSITNRAVFIKYGFLPQATDSTAAEATPERKQLYTMILAQLRSGRPSQQTGDLSTRLEDRALVANLPGGAACLDALWRLAKLAAITQLALQGKATADSDHSHERNGIRTDAEVTHALTPRVVVTVLEQWKNSGFEFELDHYIFRELVDRAVNDNEKDYFYRQMRLQGFCHSDGWEQVVDDGQQDFLYCNVSSPKNKRQSEIDPVPGRILVREIFGEAPVRSSWPGEASPVENQELNDTARLVDTLDRGDGLIGEIKGILEISDWAGGVDPDK